MKSTLGIFVLLGILCLSSVSTQSDALAESNSHAVIRQAKEARAAAEKTAEERDAVAEELADEKSVDGDDEDYSSLSEDEDGDADYDGADDDYGN